MTCTTPGDIQGLEHLVEYCPAHAPGGSCLSFSPRALLCCPPSQNQRECGSDWSFSRRAWVPRDFETMRLLIFSLQLARDIGCPHDSRFFETITVNAEFGANGCHQVFGTVVAQVHFRPVDVVVDVLCTQCLTACFFSAALARQRFVTVCRLAGRDIVEGMQKTRVLERSKTQRTARLSINLPTPRGHGRVLEKPIRPWQAHCSESLPTPVNTNMHSRDTASAKPNMTAVVLKCSYVAVLAEITIQNSTN